MATDHQQHPDAAHGHSAHASHTAAASPRPAHEAHPAEKREHVAARPTTHSPDALHSRSEPKHGEHSHAATPHAVAHHDGAHKIGGHAAQHAPHSDTRAHAAGHEGHPAPKQANHSESVLNRQAAVAAHARVASVSHFHDPIPHDGKPHGFSRLAGDAPAEVKQYVVATLISECHRQGLGREDTAHVLAIARLESGFNPDAAATSSSACGVGQFIRSTGEAYGLSGHNRFDLHANAKAMVEHFVDNKELAKAHGKGEAYVYAFYHDGPNRNSGGLDLAHREVLPYVKSYEDALSNMAKGAHHAADSMRVFLADTGQHAKDFVHGLADRAHQFVGGHRGEAIAREESPFQRDHMQRVAWQQQPGAMHDSLGLMAEKTGALAAALADTMRAHGFDARSVAQAGELAGAVMVGVGSRKPGQDVLVIHKDGDILASVASRQELAGQMKPGDTVLDLRSLDRVALLGFDASQLASARSTLPGQGPGVSNLEVAQMAFSNGFGRQSEPPGATGRGREMI